MPNWFDEQAIEGYSPGAPGSFRSGLESIGGTVLPPGTPPGSVPPGAQPTGAYQGPGSFQGLGDFGGDPFGYSGGSLLTPWTQKFQAPAGSEGGYGAPEFTPFEFGQFNYDTPRFDAIQAEKFQAPEKFSYADFEAPTAETMVKDPGYEFRLKEGERAITNSAAAKGILRTGGTLKDFLNYGQEAASQEYGNIYGRARDVYGTNRANAAENYDRNFSTQFGVHQGNVGNALAAYNASTGALLGAGQLGLSAATGAYDRNLNLARTQWEDEASNRAAQASAGAANANQSYNRALDEYRMAYDIFQGNQANQFNRLTALSDRGQNAADRTGDYGSNYAANQGNLLTGQGNAQAAGKVGSANAWNTALGDIGNTVSDSAMAYYGGGWSGGGGRTPYGAPAVPPRGNADLRRPGGGWG